jgi:hypothetical protein
VTRREGLRVSRRRGRATAGLIASVVIGAALVSAVLVRDWANPKNYDLAVSRACLRKSATVSEIPRGEGIFVFPGFWVRFPGEPEEKELGLYFASSTDEAKSAETPDSERLQRRRNVLADREASAPWDKRVSRCLRVRGSR